VTTILDAHPATTVARAVNATKIYGRGDTAVRALDEATVEFDQRQFTARMGPSGSGKSTLMHCLAGLDTLTSGRISIGDISLPMDLAGRRPDRAWLDLVIGTVGVLDRMNHVGDLR
jgi:putative ABC transport system ATP-binding protein